MITLCIRIADAPPNGVAIEMLPVPHNPTDMERIHYQLIDIGLKTACQIILEGAQSGEMIDGEKIEHTVRAMFERLTKKPHSG